MDRVALAVKFDPGKSTGKKSTRPLSSRDRLGISAADTSEDDKAGKILIDRTESVIHPTPHAGTVRDNRSGVHEGVGGIVIDLLGHHRIDDGDVVGAGRDVGKEVADRLAALAMLREGGSGSEASKIRALQLCDRHALGEGCRHCFPVQCTQLWFGIEGLEMAWSARHAEEDHPFCAGDSAR